MDTLAARLGNEIRKHRLAAGLTQEDLAERSGLHWTYISQVERGRRNLSVDALARIGAGLGMAGWELMRDAEAGTIG